MLFSSLPRYSSLFLPSQSGQATKARIYFINVYMVARMIDLFSADLACGCMSPYLLTFVQRLRLLFSYLGYFLKFEYSSGNGSLQVYTLCAPDG